MHTVSSIIPGKTMMAADLMLSRLPKLNLLKTEVETRPKAGIKIKYKTAMMKALSTIKKY